MLQHYYVASSSDESSSTKYFSTNLVPSGKHAPKQHQACTSNDALNFHFANGMGADEEKLDKRACRSSNLGVSPTLT
eukprot:552564-Amphidinium_carterae.1